MSSLGTVVFDTLKGMYPSTFQAALEGDTEAGAVFDQTCRDATLTVKIAEAYVQLAFSQYQLEKGEI